jgi:rubrerythrin
MAETSILDDAKNIFQQMKDFGGSFELSGDEGQLYAQAMDMEAKSRGYYLDKADQVEPPEQKGLFKKLAEEENKHYQLLSNLVDFVEAPKTWLEDARFSRLNEY